MRDRSDPIFEVEATGNRDKTLHKNLKLAS